LVASLYFIATLNPELGTLNLERRCWLACGVIVLAALAAYHNSFSGPFIYDDIGSITQNSTIHHLWPIGKVLSPPSDQPGQTVGGRPLLNLSLALNYALSGDAVWSYHALNLVIHILAGLTLFGIVRRTLLRLKLRRAGPAAALNHEVSFADAALPLAFTIALLWTLHPLQTESVTYVIQRAESLMGLFYLLTIYCFLRSVENRYQVSDIRCQVSGVRSKEKPSEGGSNSALQSFSSSVLWWRLASIFCCLAGMATKEVMVSAPLMVLLYDRTFVAGTFREAWRQRWKFYLGLAGTWLLLGYLMTTGNGRGGTVSFGGGISAWTYALTQFRAIVHYLRLSIWPQPLVFNYGRSVLRQVAEAAPYAALILSLVALTAVGLWRNHALGFLGAWFFAILAPSSSVVPIVTETVAEHRMYLPLAVVVVLVVVGLYRLLGRRSVAICLVLSVGLGVLTARRNEDYRSELALWSDTAAKCPDNPWAHLAEGHALLFIGRLTEAQQQFELCLRIKPDFPQAYNNLGLLLDHQGRMKEAMDDYRQALRFGSNLVEARYNLAIDLHLMGRLDEAIDQYREVVLETPDDALAQCGLGSALAQMGLLGEAVAHLQLATRLDPNYADAHNKLAKALIMQGHLAGALAEFEETVRINPKSAEAHYNVGNALAQSARLPEAIRQFELALQLNPGFTAARNNLELARHDKAAEPPSTPNAER
jgi:tetratricopeptide (TPR) repeat protein